MHSASVDDGFCGKSKVAFCSWSRAFMPMIFPPRSMHSDGFNIIEGRAAQILKRAQQRDGVAGIVELAVVIEDAAAQAGRMDAGKFLNVSLRERSSERPSDSWPDRRS